MSPTPIRFDSINLVVTDMAASRAFYSRLGLEFANSHEPVWDLHHVTAVNPGGEDASLGIDLDSASFASEWNNGWPGGPGVVLGFHVPTRQAVDDLVAELAAAGAAVQQAPWDAFWGARYAVVSDPDGQAVGIMSPVDDALRSDHAPPS
jgi:catechol 2,3-dioxygenase-like lactoylglutathione lyase family enzyme